MQTEHSTPPRPMLLTPAEVARLLRVSRTKVYELMKAGRLKRVELGTRCTRIPVASLDDLVRQTVQ
jgi:excisionase family DNA binding protein